MRIVIPRLNLESGKLSTRTQSLFKNCIHWSNILAKNQFKTIQLIAISTYIEENYDF